MITNIKEFRKVCPQSQWQIGKKYDRLKIIGFSHKNKRGVIYWFIQCDCKSKLFIVQYGSLQSKKTRSCGCIRLTRVNHNYFSTYTNKSCYIAGWWASDGNISHYSIHYYQNVINLADYDKLILLYIQKELKYKNKLAIMKQKQGNNHELLSLGFRSPQIAKDFMEKFYIYCRKGSSSSPIAKIQGIFSPEPRQLAFPPLISKEHILAYIFGYFEGDGCLYWHNPTKSHPKENKWGVFFHGNQSVLTQIAQHLYNFNIVSTLYKPSLNRTTYNLQYRKQSDVKSFMEAKQKYSPFYLPRKTYPQTYLEHKQFLANYDKKYCNKKKPTRPVIILPDNKQKFYLW